MSYTVEEIFNDLKDMASHKVAREDGFLAFFFQCFWHIIGRDIGSFCLQLLNDDSMLEDIGATLIVLIPKLSRPSRIQDFRPISLCSVLYKIISKIVANGFRSVLDECIDKAQSAFIPGRMITDNVLLA